STLARVFSVFHASDSCSEARLSVFEENAEKAKSPGTPTGVQASSRMLRSSASTNPASVAGRLSGGAAEVPGALTDQALTKSVSDSSKNFGAAYTRVPDAAVAPDKARVKFGSRAIEVLFSAASIIRLIVSLLSARIT